VPVKACSAPVIRNDVRTTPQDQRTTMIHGLGVSCFSNHDMGVRYEFRTRWTRRPAPECLPVEDWRLSALVAGVPARSEDDRRGGVTEVRPETSPKSPRHRVKRPARDAYDPHARETPGSWRHTPSPTNLQPGDTRRKTMSVNGLTRAVMRGTHTTTTGWCSTRDTRIRSG